MANQTVLIMPNMTRANTVELMQSILEQLSEIGFTPLMDNRYKGMFSGVCCDAFETQISRCDLVLTVGGDGTILHSAKHAMMHNKPILGINTGRLGYLAQVEADEIALLSRLAHGAYSIQKRMILEVATDGMEETHYAINDVVISKGSHARLVDLDIVGDGEAIGSYRADGLIFATPTGSTAYSLSAGGPIVDPSIETIILTPICPHSLYDRSILLSPQLQIQVRSRFINSPDNIIVSVDGERIAGLDEGHTVHIQKSDKYVHFINFTEKSFSSILSQKLKSRG